MDPMTQITKSLNDVVTSANEYSTRKADCARLGITALASHRWAVVLDEPGCSLAVARKGDNYAFRLVRGDLAGTMLFTKQDALKISALFPNTKIILDDNLVAERKADAERLLAELQ